MRSENSGGSPQRTRLTLCIYQMLTAWPIYHGHLLFDLLQPKILQDSTVWRMKLADIAYGSNPMMTWARLKATCGSKTRLEMMIDSVL